MIDLRHKTFLEVCKLKSFTKAAEALCITQPAVSQHIRYLEELYGGELIVYSRRHFSLTEKGRVLYNFLITVQVDCSSISKIINRGKNERSAVAFGATLSIGEYVMPPVISKIIKNDSNCSISMIVDNTQELLKKLDEGVIQFALIEGSFNKTKYESMVFSHEPFIGVCSPYSHSKSVDSIDALFSNLVILREKGSGTRRVFEQILEQSNVTIESFQNAIEIGNMSAIKELVKSDLGITFLYKVAAQQELDAGTLCEIQIKDFSQIREFNFVFLKKSFFRTDFKFWYNKFKEYLM